MQTKHEFETLIEKEYENLTADEFDLLLANVLETYNRVGNSVEYADLVPPVYNHCLNNRSISIKQYKLLRGYVYRNRVKMSVKQF